tara:strand:- start:11 stop:619 length:609 start_codon:yes stop_codon:yes gene_type:complete
MTSLRRVSKLGLMNKFLAILVLSLVFCNISNAGSIKDYEKGGLKLGGSLLDLMYEDEIKENFYPITHGDKFTSVMYIPNPFTYPEEIGLYLVIVKPNDKNYTIQGFYLFEDFPNDFEGCMKKQDEYMKINTKLFNLKPDDYGIAPHPNPDINGKWRAVIFEYTPKKETSSILCYHFEDEPERNNLKMGVLTREFANHISVRQ